MNIEIYPQEMVVIDGAEIYFGMKRSAVETAIGKGQLVRNRYYYYNNEMAIDYNVDKEVEFIEFLGGIDGSLHPNIYGVSAFEVFADDLVNLLRQKNAGEVGDSERGYCYSFFNISIGIYRERKLSDVEEMIAEQKVSGIPFEDNDYVAMEMKRANHWSAIGAGIKEYYKR